MARVAVIAVHGVADQQACDTARSVVNLLHAADARSAATAGAVTPAGPASAPDVHYTPFVESTLHVPVAPLHVRVRAGHGRVTGRVAAAARRTLFSSFETRALDRGPSAGGVDREYMYNQLREYSGATDPATHRTIALAGERSTPQGRTRVDVYELYWADLSRLGSGLVRILSEFYQLLFHLSSLGRTAVGIARVQHHNRTSWKLLSLAQSFSSFLLVLPIAIFNLYLLLVAFGLVVAKIPEGPRVWVCVAIGGTLCAASFAALVYRRWRGGFGGWSLTQATGFALGALTVWLVVEGLEAGAYPLLAALWIALSVVAGTAIARAYQKRRPGAVVWSMIAAATVVIGALSVAEGAADDPDGAVLLIGRASEFLFFWLGISWTLLVQMHLVTWVLGEIAVRRVRSEPDLNLRDPRSQAERAVWTGRIGLFVPTALFLIMTLGLWLLLWTAVRDQVGDYAYMSLRGDWTLASQTIDGLLMDSAGPSFNGFLILVGLAFAMVVWAFFPAVLAERTPPRGARGVVSRRLGNWLDYGFILARLAGRVALFAAIVVFPAGYVLADWNVDALPAIFQGDSLLKSLVALLGGSTIGLIALRTQLSGRVLGLKAPLDVALDVDNWLRERPVDANPTARICARYASLLRHVCEHGVADGDPYTAIVIVAHSQGTVITADFLRFVRQNKPHEPAFARILSGELPVYLFTMGCPLRQLYGRRFPHQYKWATHGLAADAAAAGGMRYGTLATKAQPRPGELGVPLWVNAYCSGDYVGRYLWRADGDPGRWDAAVQAGACALNVSTDGAAAGTIGNASRVELCFGAGAHTHYFDEDAVRVGLILDQLIGIAAVGKQHYPFHFPDLRNAP